MGCGASQKRADWLSALEATSATAFCNGMAQYSVRASFPAPEKDKHKAHSRVMKLEIQGSGKLHGASLEFVDPPSQKNHSKKLLKYELEFWCPIGEPIIKAKTYMSAGHVTLSDFFAEHLCNANSKNIYRFSLSLVGKGGPPSAVASPLDECAEASFTTVGWKKPVDSDKREVQTFRGPLLDVKEAPERSSKDCVARVPTRGGGGTDPTKYPLQMTVCEDENVLTDEQLQLVVFLTLYELGETFGAGWPGRGQYETFDQVEARRVANTSHLTQVVPVSLGSQD